MPAPLDPATLPLDAIALRALLLHRETEYAADLQAARHGLQEQVLRNEQLKRRLAKLLRARFGASSEKLRTAIEQLELILGDLEEQIAETAPAQPHQLSSPEPAGATRRKPARRPLPENLPRTTVEHPAPCACPKCGGTLHRLGEDVTEAGLRASGVPRHPPCASKAVVPRLRQHRTGAGSEPAHSLRSGHAGFAGACAGGGICRSLPTLADGVGQTARLMRPLVDAIGAHVMAAGPGACR